MSQERISDVKVNVTPNKDYEQRYTKSDLEVVFRRGEWRSWNEVIDWLKEHGEADNELTPGEVIAMKRDLEQLKQQGKPFTADVDAIYQLTKGGAAANDSGTFGRGQGYARSGNVGTLALSAHASRIDSQVCGSGGQLYQQSIYVRTRK
jgi:hypothetical protein